MIGERQVGEIKSRKVIEQFVSDNQEGTVSTNGDAWNLQTLERSLMDGIPGELDNDADTVKNRIHKALLGPLIFFVKTKSE